MTNRPGSRTPLIAGVSQQTIRDGDVGEPLDQMTDVYLGALEDTGVTIDPGSVDMIGVIGGFWEYRDPGRLVADRVGSPGASTVLTGFGGQTPQSLIGSFCERIGRGEIDVAIVLGAESIATRRRLRAEGNDMAITDQAADTEPDERFASAIDVATDYETGVGLILPTTTYAIVEVALRHARGESNEAHLSRIARMWANMSTVAADNPYAWHRTPRSAAEIATPSVSNRLVGYPYTRRMNAEPTVDMAAAVLLMSGEAADDLGVDPARRVFPHHIVEAVDTPSISQRHRLDESEALRAIAARMMNETGIRGPDVDHLDLYSCFPSVVQIACEAFGIDETRQLTQTGGLHFGGGPMNNYVSHAIASLVTTLRNDPGSTGMVHANGGLITKHSVATYSTTPPESFRLIDAQPQVDTSRNRTAQAGDASGTFDLEAYTVVHDRSGPTNAIAALLDADGSRGWATSTDRAVFDALMADDLVGEDVRRSAEGTFTF